MMINRMILFCREANLLAIQLKAIKRSFEKGNKFILSGYCNQTASKDLINLFATLNLLHMFTNKTGLSISATCFSVTILFSAFNFRPKDNVLTAAEKKAGWKLLFDGNSTNGWRTYKNRPGSWQVSKGELFCPKGAKDYADLITNDQYDNFELSLDWKIGPGANSGIMYHVLETHNAPYETGPEYQLIDDNG